MLSILASILSYDLWFYVSHVCLHMWPLQRFHKEHHTAVVPTFLDTYKGHTFETVFQGVGAVIPFLWLSYSVQDMCILFFFLQVRGMMRHDGRFAWLIGNHHLLHHMNPNYNYGEYWIDSLLGTRYPIEASYRKGILYV